MYYMKVDDLMKQLGLPLKDGKHCVICREPFLMDVNVFTPEGVKECALSGMCETCFDKTFQEEE